jgi:hypothetical protein
MDFSIKNIIKPIIKLIDKWDKPTAQFCTGIAELTPKKYTLS